MRAKLCQNSVGFHGESSAARKLPRATPSVIFVSLDRSRNADSTPRLSRADPVVSIYSALQSDRATAFGNLTVQPLLARILSLAGGGQA